VSAQGDLGLESSATFLNHNLRLSTRDSERRRGESWRGYERLDAHLGINYRVAYLLSLVFLFAHNSVCSDSSMTSSFTRASLRSGS
jgi:hypothetical protein